MCVSSMLPSVPTPQTFLQITIFLNTLNKTFHDKTECRPSAPKRTLFTNGCSLHLVARMSRRMWKNGENNHFPQLCCTEKLPYLCQLSSLALLLFLPLFQISADSWMQKIAPNYEFQMYSIVLRVFHILSEPRGIPLKMSDVLFNFEKEALGCKLKVGESPLSYINQQPSLKSKIALSIYIPYPILSLFEWKTREEISLTTLTFLIFGFLVDGLN